MTIFNHAAFMAKWRSQRKTIPTSLYNEVMTSIEAGLGATPPAAASASSGDPAWIIEAKARIGQREIKGPKHNSWIANGWARLGAKWFNNDETPWCGFFVAHCMDKAGLDYPDGGLFARAKAWLDWGTACSPCYGAVVVFGRTGGGHVGFLVGEDGGYYRVLGGNQSDAVNIMKIAKDRSLGCRWPVGVANPLRKLPKGAGGAVSSNEA